MLKYIYLYYGLVNAILFIIMGIDKLCAKLHYTRVREATLLTLSLVGGGLGGFLGMKIFHHKTRKRYFFFTFVISIIAHICLVFLIKNNII